ncbi:hypothetical protein M1466_02210 [Candidatus Dependentiae bacterium]|nr:hypothetical protein [Candidatus Dependentiae bacterium]
MRRSILLCILCCLMHTATPMVLMVQVGLLAAGAVIGAVSAVITLQTGGADLLRTGKKGLTPEERYAALVQQAELLRQEMVPFTYGLTLLQPFIKTQELLQSASIVVDDAVIAKFIDHYLGLQSYRQVKKRIGHTAKLAEAHAAAIVQELQRQGIHDQHRNSLLLVQETAERNSRQMKMLKQFWLQYKKELQANAS